MTPAWQRRVAMEYRGIDISDLPMPGALREVSEALYVEEMREAMLSRAFARVMVGDG